jgi:hypothetical protein
MVLSLPQGNHVAKFVKDPIYRTKVTFVSCGNDPVVKIIFIVKVTLTFKLMTPK